MRFQKNLALLMAVTAAGSALAADPAPTANPEPKPAFLTAPAKSPGTDADRTPQFDDPVPRPTPQPSLLPNDIPAPATMRPGPMNPPGSGKSKPSVKPHSTSAEFELGLRYRKARNVAEMDEKVRAAWDDSRAAKTDLRKRQALKRYYDVLFARMLAVDRGIAPLVEQRHKSEDARLVQSQVAPTLETGQDIR